MALTDRAMMKVKEMIQSGELRPGDRLPPEQELSHRLGLSRSSLREAVKALEAIRVLDVRRGDGTYVTSLEPALLLDALTFILDFHKSSAVLEVFAVRRILETEAAALAAVNASAEDIRGLWEVFEGLADDDIDALIAHDKKFHSRLAAASGNGYLAGLVETVSDQTVRARYWRGITDRGAIDRTLAEHRMILEAVESGDASLARALMLSHIAAVENWVRINAG